MSDILNKILATKVVEVSAAKTAISAEAIQELARAQTKAMRLSLPRSKKPAHPKA